MAKHYPLRVVQEDRAPEITLVPALIPDTYSRYGRLILHPDHPDHRAGIDATKSDEPDGAHTIEGIARRHLAVIETLIEQTPPDGFDFLAPHTPVQESPADASAPTPRHLHLVPRPDDAS
jgi:hypothetical protein